MRLRFGDEQGFKIQTVQAAVRDDEDGVPHVSLHLRDLGHLSLQQGLRRSDQHPVEHSAVALSASECVFWSNQRFAISLHRRLNFRSRRQRI